MSAVEHGAFVLAGLLVYLTSTKLSHQHRHPSAAFAWVLIMVLLPYLGMPLYFLFGLRKDPRPKAPLKRPTPIPAEAAPTWVQSLLDALALPAPTRNTRVRFQPDGQSSLKVMFELIGSATRDIELCTFILGNDAIARSLSDALVKAAKRGVKVRVLLDDVGSWWVSRSLLRSLRREGVAVQLFMPVFSNIRRGRVNLRNHRKLLVVDGERVWGGGRNLAAEYFTDQGQHKAWTDLSFVVEGPLAKQAQDLYEQDWQAASRTVVHANTQMNQVIGPESGPVAQWIPSGPDHADDTIYALLLASAYRAEQRIVLITPYFVPDDSLLAAWCMACRRGVEVTLLIPHRSNHRLADVAREPSLRELMKAGGKVVLFPHMLHAKAVILDEDLALCGSVNLDGRSLFLNYELTTAFYGQAEINWLSQWALQLISQGQLARSTTPSAARELIEGLVRIVGFQL
jgi:cardiolipin synthase